ncbi:hypothetical protein [Roseovarius sp.]|uniref:hypothetical protein n=1 Tax=Roseovarius sp. TaxID=1486281 RepID=UPI00257E9DC1|nr:hypothetical protein [Roseovarius sp.]|tara:strand:- start:1587 stop:1919 length:333 start_codon:yes stop_codon:yes gene_type:complete
MMRLAQQSVFFILHIMLQIIAIVAEINADITKSPGNPGAAISAGQGAALPHRSQPYPHGTHGNGQNWHNVTQNCCACRVRISFPHLFRGWLGRISSYEGTAGYIETINMP